LILVLPKILAVPLIAAVHEQGLLWHLRKKRIMEKIGSFVKVHNFGQVYLSVIENCPLCCLNTKHKVPRGQKINMGMKLHVRKPRTMWYFDFVTLEYKYKIYNSILVVVDLHSKFCFLIPFTSSATSTQVVELLMTRVFSVSNFPAGIVSDKASQFTSKAFALFAEIMKIQHFRVASARQNLSELINSFVVKSFRNVFQTYGLVEQSIPLFSAVVQITLNTNICAPHNCAPELLFFGYQRLRPKNQLLSCLPQFSATFIAHEILLGQKLILYFSQFTQFIQAENARRRKQLEKFNADFREGTYVLLSKHNPNTQKFHKLKTKYYSKVYVCLKTYDKNVLIAEATPRALLKTEFGKNKQLHLSEGVIIAKERLKIIHDQFPLLLLPPSKQIYLTLFNILAKRDIEQQVVVQPVRNGAGVQQTNTDAQLLQNLMQMEKMGNKGEIQKNNLIKYIAFKGGIKSPFGLPVKLIENKYIRSIFDSEHLYILKHKVEKLSHRSWSGLQGGSWPRFSVPSQPLVWLEEGEGKRRNKRKVKKFIVPTEGEGSNYSTEITSVPVASIPEVGGPLLQEIFEDDVFLTGSEGSGESETIDTDNDDNNSDHQHDHDDNDSDHQHGHESDSDHQHDEDDNERDHHHDEDNDENMSVTSTPRKVTQQYLGSRVTRLSLSPTVRDMQPGPSGRAVDREQAGPKEGPAGTAAPATHQGRPALSIKVDMADSDFVDLEKSSSPDRSARAHLPIEKSTRSTRVTRSRKTPTKKGELN
jgi:hypothetical protein